jgi:glycosyltransferase involved in cell wall biosynthesis
VARIAPAATTDPPIGEYAVVHLVAGELHKDLIGPQVVDHMAWQAATAGAGRPAIVIVGFLEPVRVAVSAAARARVRELRERAAPARVLLLPFSSRLGEARAARWNARRLRRLTGSRPVVFHCRGEAAVEWALQLGAAVPRSAIVADVRGPWAEELLFARGFDAPERADARTAADYEGAIDRLRGVIGRAPVVLSVSPGMLDWLESQGTARDRLVYVPCCVTEVGGAAAGRERARRELGLHDKLVFAYLGSATRFQYLKDGVAPFFRIAMEERPDAHLLVVTPDLAAMRALLDAEGVPAERTTLRRVRHEEVGGVLAAADAGLLLSERHRLAAVVQPVKLAEYLAAGVPVVVTRSAASAAALVERGGAGVVLERTPTEFARHRDEVARAVEAVARGGGALRAAALAACERELTWARYTTDVRAAYARALAANETTFEEGEAACPRAAR